MHFKRLLVWASIGLISACGASSLKAPTGSLSLGLEFPQSFKTLLLPDQTHSVYVLVYGSANPLTKPLLPRALTPKNPRMTMTNVPIGLQTVLVGAMDCDGKILTAAKKQVDVLPAPTLTSVTLELSTNFSASMNSDELAALDRLQPDCAQPVPTPIPTPMATPRPSTQPEATPRPNQTPSSTPTPEASISPQPLPSPSSSTLIVRVNQENPFKMKINQEGNGLALEMSYTGSEVVSAMIDRVEFLINGGKVASSGSAPYNYFWETDKRSEGQYTLQAVGYDKDGNEIARSTPVTVLLLVQYQTSSSGGNNGPNPLFCTPGIDIDGNIDLCEDNGASFSTVVTVTDGTSGLDPITVTSP